MRGRTFTLGVLAVAIVIAGFISYYASPHPDGLMYVAHAKGFIAAESASLTQDWPLAGYAVRGVDNARLSGGLAGVIGCALCFGLVALMTRRRSS